MPCTTSKYDVFYDKTRKRILYLLNFVKCDEILLWNCSVYIFRNFYSVSDPLSSDCDQSPWNKVPSGRVPHVWAPSTRKVVTGRFNTAFKIEFSCTQLLQYRKFCLGHCSWKNFTHCLWSLSNILNLRKGTGFCRLIQRNILTNHFFYENVKVF